MANIRIENATIEESGKIFKAIKKVLDKLGFDVSIHPHIVENSEDTDEVKFKWTPWEVIEEYPNIPLSRELKGVNEPPCKHCKYFNPVVSFRICKQRNEVIATGATICHNEFMYNDFSCFRPKEED